LAPSKYTVDVGAGEVIADKEQATPMFTGHLIGETVMRKNPPGPFSRD
jgi:hypothetical protein